MALNIEGASLGVDASGIQRYITDINTNLVEEACTQLQQGLAELRAATDAVWVGKSAETFKSNMEHDVDSIVSALMESREALVNEIKDLGAKMGEVDENLVQAR